MPRCARKTARWQCRNEASPGFKMCEEHLGQNRMRVKRWKDRKEETHPGRCDTPGCHARKLPAGSKCQACREKYRATSGRGLPIPLGQDEGDRLIVHASLNELLKHQR